MGMRAVAVQGFGTSFLVLSSSELKLLSNRAKNKLSTMKFPITKVGRKTARHVPGPWDDNEN
jgi:hypothetical protein